jgi:hypothetical protein
VASTKRASARLDAAGAGVATGAGTGFSSEVWDMAANRR